MAVCYFPIILFAFYYFSLFAHLGTAASHPFLTPPFPTTPAAILLGTVYSTRTSVLCCPLFRQAAPKQRVRDGTSLRSFLVVADNSTGPSHSRVPQPMELPCSERRGDGRDRKILVLPTHLPSFNSPPGFEGVSGCKVVVVRLVHLTGPVPCGRFPFQSSSEGGWELMGTVSIKSRRERWNSMCAPCARSRSAECCPFSLMLLTAAWLDRLSVPALL